MTDQTFNEKSLERLSKVHLDLERVFKEAITASPWPFQITQGLRTPKEQQALYEAGKSKTMNSRHLTGHAVDIVVYKEGKVSWDFALYEQVARHVLAVAKLCDVPVVWGGDWESFKDGPHFEMDRRFYKV